MNFRAEIKLMVVANKGVKKAAMFVAANFKLSV